MGRRISLGLAVAIAAALVATGHDARAEELGTLTLEPSAELPQGPDPLLVTTGVVIFGVPYRILGLRGRGEQRLFGQVALRAGRRSLGRHHCAPHVHVQRLQRQPRVRCPAARSLGPRTGRGRRDPHQGSYRPARQVVAVREGQPRPRRAGQLRRGRGPAGLRRLLNRIARRATGTKPNAQAEARAPGSTSLCKPSSVSRPGHPEARRRSFL